MSITLWKRKYEITDAVGRIFNIRGANKEDALIGARRIYPHMKLPIKGMKQVKVKHNGTS